MAASGRYGLPIMGGIVGDPSNSVAAKPSRVSGSAVWRAVEADRAPQDADAVDATAVSAEGSAPSSQLSTPAVVSRAPAPITAASLLGQAKARILQLKVEIAGIEGKKSELALLELMVSAESVADAVRKA